MTNAATVPTRPLDSAHFRSLRSGKRLVVLGLLAFILLPACHPSPAPSNSSAAPIKIGLTAVMTGSNGSAGSRFLQGVELSIREWNARGGVLGRQIEMITRDDEGKPEKAVMVAQELVNENVAAVIGPWNSGCVLAGSPVFHHNGIVQIVAASNKKVTEQGFPRLFRVGIRDDRQAEAVNAWLVKNNIHSVAILHDKTAYGQGVAEKVKALTEARGGSVPVYNGVSTEELDFRSNIATIKQAGAQAVFWGGIYNQAGPLFNQIREQGLTVMVLIPGGSLDPLLIETVGSNPQGLYAAFGPGGVDPLKERAFYENFRRTFGPEGSFTIYGYDGANALLEAMRRAGTTDPARVAEVLHSESFDALLGKISFDAAGEVQGIGLGLWEIRDGKFVVMK